MLIHIVCWKYKDDVSDDVRREHRRRLAALTGLVPGIIDLRVGADMLHLDRSFDTGLVAHFADRDALQIYTDHPEHVQVANIGKTIAERVVSVDFIE